MFSPRQFLRTVFVFNLLLGRTFGRDKWLERKNRISFHPRHLGHEQPTCSDLDCAYPPDLMMDNAFLDPSTLSSNISDPNTCDCYPDSIPTVTISGTDSATVTNVVTVVIGGDGAAPTTSGSNVFTTSIGAATSIVIVFPISGPTSFATSTTAVPSPSSTSTPFGNFGSCPTPQIKFGVGFDNQEDTSFEPVNQTFYNHAAADFDTIATFICSTLESSCGADETAQNTCAQAKSSGDSQPSGTGNQADAFNAEFGIETDFASVQPADSSSTTSDGIESTTESQAGTSTSAPSPTLSTSDSTSLNTPSSATNSAPAASTSDSSQSNNLQTFTGSLGGITAPAVIDLGNNQFQVDGDSKFNDIKDALSRSCDVQHNQCADAANASKNENFTVHDCDVQEQSCDAASS